VLTSNTTKTTATHGSGGSVNDGLGSNNTLSPGEGLVLGGTPLGPDLGKGLVGQDGLTTGLEVLVLLLGVVVTTDGEVSSVVDLVVLEVTGSPVGRSGDAGRESRGRSRDGGGNGRTGQSSEEDNGLREHFVV